MAEVTSGTNLTVVILDESEAKALAHVFEADYYGRLMPELNELAEAFIVSNVLNEGVR
tara:strand:- start:345 stop:518 length:174 start_codon:yes stop_codon:yes gene_type:complete